MTTQPLSKKTFGNQSRLPRLPVLDLDETCDKFMAWVTPLLDEPELAQTQEAVAAFRSEDGPRLQQALLEWAQQDIPNWLEPFWDDMYLESRIPIAININYFLLLKDPPAGALPQIKRAARLIISLLKFKTLLDTEELEPDQLHGRPLCMMQFRQLFSTTRVPHKQRDHLRSPVSTQNPTPADATHIVVLRKGHIFRLEVLTETGHIRSVADLEHDLESILKLSKTQVPDEAAVGLLTTMNRDEWAAARERLLNIDPQNANFFEAIETAFFAICLEDETLEVDAELAHLMLHGDGRNRWFDKALQFIVCPNGKAALNGEHSGHDATTSLRLVNAISQDDGQIAEAPQPQGETRPPQRLEFRLDDALSQVIQKAAREFDAFVADTQIRVLEFNQFGKGLIKSLKVSPDGLVQLAAQLAQYRLFGRNYSTYESVMTRLFLHGRTEAMRSVTPEVVRFVKTMTTDEVDETAKVNALHQAIRAHLDRVKACRAAAGVERHLFGLLNIYKRKGEELDILQAPEIFNSPGWLALRHDTLSTSNGSSDALDMFCFGPVVNDGFGIAYLIQNERIVFVVTSRTAMTEKLEKFVGYVEEALLKMTELLEKPLI